MPYDPTPSGDQYYASIQWDDKGPYQITASGKKFYISPAAAATEHTDNPVGAKLVAWANSKGATYADPGGAAPKGGFASNRGAWDTSTGDYDKGNFFNTSLGGLILGGGMIAAPYAAAALAGSGGSATAPALTEATASGAATGAEAAGIPVAGSAASTALPGVAGGTGAFSAAGDWVPDAGTAATAPAADAAGSTPSWLGAAKDVGQVASDISSGRAQGRVAESGINNSADRNLVDLYSNQIKASGDENTYGLNAARDANSYGLNAVNAGVNVGNLDVSQKNYALDAPGKRAGNAVRGDILANAQDVSFDQPNIPKTTISGGLRPSMFSGNTRQLGGLLSSQALQQQQAGDTFAPLPTVPAYQPPPAYKPAPPAPTLNGPSQSNGFDTGLNVAGYAGLGADLLSKYGKYFL